MEHLFSAINNIFNFVIPVSDFFWDFPTNFSWYASIPILGNFSLAVMLLIGWASISASGQVLSR